MGVAKKSKFKRGGRNGKKVETHLTASTRSFQQLALWMKLSRRRGKRRENAHWLSCAETTFSGCIIDDTRKTLHMLCLYVPLSVFWSLFDQQVSFDQLYIALPRGKYHVLNGILPLPRCAEHDLDISSVAHERPVVRHAIPGVHATGGEPVARAAHHTPDGPRGVPLPEEPSHIQVPPEANAARRRCSRDCVRLRRMHRDAFGRGERDESFSEKLRGSILVV